MPISDSEAFWLFDQGVANRTPSEHRRVSLVRVDDEEVTSPGLYRGACDCGWETRIRSQTLVREELDEHLREKGVA